MSNTALAAIVASMLLTFSEAEESILEVEKTIQEVSESRLSANSIEEALDSISQGDSNEDIIRVLESEGVDVSHLMSDSTQNSNNSASSQQYSAPVSSGSSDIPGVSVEEVALFDKIAQCESGGNWSINTGNSFYGGIQFTKSSWDIAKASTSASHIDYPHHATREQQIEAGKKLKDIQGWGAWPACTSSLGIR